jgi:hypothetical protein
MVKSLFFTGDGCPSKVILQRKSRSQYVRMATGHTIETDDEQ